MAAAAARLRLSARPRIGMRTRTSASAARSAGTPRASLPKSHTTGPASRSTTSGSAASPPPSATRTVVPAARSAGNRSASPAERTTSTWKWLPAPARTTLPPNGSTDPVPKTTAPAPQASDVRSTVPALPGSLMPASATASRGGFAASRSAGASGRSQTATSPCGVTVSDRPAAPFSVTSRTGTAVPASRSRCTVAAASVAKTSRTPSGAVASASDTAWRPSARKTPAASRPARRVSLRAATTRAERSVSRSTTPPEPSRSAHWPLSRPDNRPVCRSRPLGGGQRRRRRRRGGPGRSTPDGVAEWNGHPAGSRAERARRGGQGGPSSGGLLPGRGGGDGGARRLHQGGEGGRLVDGELREDATVQLDAGQLEALHEAVVGHVVEPGRRVDAGDPQLAEVALARLAVAVGVGGRVEHLLLGLAVQPRALAAVTAGLLEGGATLLLGVDRPLHACHVRAPVLVGRGGQMPSSFLRPLVSAFEITWSWSSRRLRVEDLCSNLCWLLACSRMSLPVPVTRTRLAVPLWVFCFGMSSSCSLVVGRAAARSCRTAPAVSVVRSCGVRPGPGGS